MRSNVTQNAKITEVTTASAVSTANLNDGLACKEVGRPSVKSLSPRSAAKAEVPAAGAQPLEAHSDLRAKSRTLVQVNEAAVNQTLGSAAKLLGEIDPQRLANFYKHGSMMLNSPASDKSFLVDCLARLYLSAPDRSHPNATDQDWMDDQEVLWGDELMFLFENSQQIEKLSSEGKAYFADHLLSRSGVVRKDVGPESTLKQALLHARQRMSAEIHS